VIEKNLKVIAFGVSFCVIFKKMCTDCTSLDCEVFHEFQGLDGAQLCVWLQSLFEGTFNIKILFRLDCKMFKLPTFLDYDEQNVLCSKVLYVFGSLI
jgi:hypothetical protein